MKRGKIMWGIYEIEETITKWATEGGITDLRLVTYEYEKGVLYIYTVRPDYMIGADGSLIDKYSQIFKKNIRNFKKVEIEGIYY